ncbi:MAG: murein DD-endopeptidase MepM/ murein hydrolase activator NlpD [Saprospiraceae bacterium]
MKVNNSKFINLGLIVMTIFILIPNACTERPVLIPEEVPDLSFREHYEQTLAQDSSYSIQARQLWLQQGRDALLDNSRVLIPYQEQSIAHSKHSAYGLQVEAHLGEQIDIYVEGSSQVLVDVWKHDDIWNLLYADAAYSDSIHVPVDQSGIYQVRVQTLLSETAPFKLRITKSPQNLMPVVGADNEDAWSRFGDPRDAGKRKHEGVDIFKRRGTPIIASSSGMITTVRDEGLGGKQIWVRDERLPINHYYAHLDSQYVSEGTFVTRGDTIGTVGNTGNARTTRPHLHYGMYMGDQGAVDPFPFFGTQRKVRRFRTYRDTLPETWAGPIQHPIRMSPSSKGPIVFEGTPEAPIYVLGWTNYWWHLRLSDGRTGYMWGEN